MDNNTFALAFTPVELTLVAGSLDVPSLPLPEESFSDWLPEEIDEALQQARESLAARRYIQTQPNGTIAVDTAVAALVGALAFRDSSLVITRLVEQGSGRTRHIYFASGLIVEQEQEQDGKYRLTAVRDREVLTRRLVEFLHLTDQPAPRAQPCTLAEDEISEARRRVEEEGEKACIGFLESVGVESPTAASLARALAHPVSQSALLALAWEGEEAQRLGGFTLLEGIDGLWLFQSQEHDDRPRLEIIPCNASGAVQQIGSLARLAIPEVEE